MALQHGARSFVCPQGHSFDIARDGYVNLLQPQDRRSLAAGDSRDAVEARAALAAAGVGRALRDAVANRVAALGLREDTVVVDLGSGSGDTLGTLAAGRPLTGIGIDLSTAAAAYAARRFPALTWVVANADRRLPLLDSTVQLTLSLHGRRNAPECARVLTPDGVLLVALPAPDDLIELRTLVQGRGAERDRGPALLEEHGGQFQLVERSIVGERSALGRESLLQLLCTTYRGARHRAAERVQGLTHLEVTLRSEIFVLQRRP